MLKIDQFNRLPVVSVKKNIVKLDSRGEGDVLLRDAPSNLEKGDIVNAFVYMDASNNVAATLATPKVGVGQCAYLQVLSINDHGAFLDWGLPKDLLLPFAEQAYPVKEGQSYVVYVFTDATDRIVATTQLHHHLNEDDDGLAEGEAVDLLISGKSDLGFKAVVNGEQLGLIYHSELSQPLRFGAQMKGWVKQIRDDGKIDLSINMLDDQTRDALEARILRKLKDADGRLMISDKSPPDVIFSVFKVSKKNYKRALSSLYKQRKINIESRYIELV